MPHAALVHDNFTGPTGMGLVVGRHARWLLEAGWSLTLVGDNIPDDLAAACRVVAVRAPKHLPSLPEHLGWCARARRALAGVRADLVHVHSPLLAANADLVTTHFMSQPSYARGAYELTTGVAGALRRAQGWASRVLDHRAYTRLAGRTYISFVSEFLRDEFQRWYGRPRGGWVLAPPAPPWNPVSARERQSAREQFQVAEHVMCVGYLGGSDPRKGWPHLAKLSADDGLRLLAAGPGSEQLEFGGRRGLGFVDVDAFHAACDVIVAPAVFDSAPVAVLQAVARDIPVVTTKQCGWARAIARTGAGAVWEEPETLADAVKRAAASSSQANRERFLGEFSEAVQSRNLLAAYADVTSSRL